ncbi:MULTISPECIES: FadR/GntR family transcriptional regulator [Brucella]|uniref:FadR family transcriptional regulator n=1 Tax=Ochrobactrum soli TaxID=2448455 RepID=A0A2P9HD91_9HYPH|nr:MULTISPECIES: FadR/GntR family transcriptional regulator [Brucella]MCI1002342.1 FadR family transcriptional regulator [Ochrobactrum sp. C6C9]RRD26261.1 FadR family transcriptional regulator [Brucellaceae bacterium VT-16-1752]MDX4072195.1 FadR/GntR family transcriptional regulator [Brucella sp. NBRC 113783]NNU60091.1 FadR family transcriptional regulator [[Ochrobactrum] soli]SPL62052.1 Transcriptional regulator, GntR family [[Ochrobactrum] soli]
MKETTGNAPPPRLSGHLPHELARQIEKRIGNGEFPVGTKLPSERELSAEYAVSRPVVREALSQLKLDGLVEARAGSGVFVIDKSSEKAFRIQPLAIEETQSLEQLMELLVAVEVAATRIAAVKRTDEDLKRIKRALIGLEYAIISDQLGDEEDYAFHDAIVMATHNQHFIALCKHLEYGARHVIRQARTNTRANLTGMLDAVQDEHKAIYQAIEKGLADDAGIAAELHLRNAAKRMTTYLSGKNDL